MQWLRTMPTWGRREGRDHLFLFGHGAGPMIYEHVPRLHDTGIILATSFDGPKPPKLPRVVVVPSYVRPLLGPDQGADGTRRAFDEKKFLGFFRGLLNGDAEGNPRYSFKTRQFLQNETARLTPAGQQQQQQPGLRVVEGNVPDEQYAAELRGARFCLCLPGHFAFTPRSVQLLNAGCVPVIVSPCGHAAPDVPTYPTATHLPFARALNWSRLSVAVDQAVVKRPGGLEEALLAVPYDEWASMVTAMNTERLRFIWESNGGTAWTILLEELAHVNIEATLATPLPPHLPPLSPSFPASKQTPGDNYWPPGDFALVYTEHLANATPTLRMMPAERKLWFSSLLTATRYLEWGTGGSTVLAAWRAMQTDPRLPPLTVHSIDSSEEWMRELRRKYPIVALAEAEGKLAMRVGDIGPTGLWGQPANFSHRPKQQRVEQARRYTNAFGDQGVYDLILIDGRFREACAMYALKLAHRNTLMLMHDYLDSKEGGRRSYKRTVERYYHTLEYQHSLGLFRPKPHAAFNLLEYEKLLADPSR